MRSFARVVAGSCALALVVVGALGGAVGAQSTSPPTSSPATSAPTTGPAAPPADATDPAAYRELAATVNKNTVAIAQLTAQIDQLTAQLTQLDASIADVTQKRDALRAEITRLEDIVRARAAFIYRRANSPQIALGDIRHVQDLTTGEKYAAAATSTDASQISSLKSQAAAFDHQLADLTARRDDAQQQRDKLDASKTNLVAITDHAKEALDKAGNIPVMGDAELTAQQIVGWFDSTDAKYRLSGNTNIADLVQMYMEEGAAEHVRPELAFAQAIIETGSFAHATDNNYAGIGACDSCQGEPAFATPRDGVRGQIQLLRNFADPSSRAANLANPPSPVIFGSDPVHAAYSFDHYVAKGQIPTWNLMGNGNWATDPNYAPKVLGVYFEMASYAAHNSSA
jgi:cell division protein FtsB